MSMYRIMLAVLISLFLSASLNAGEVKFKFKGDFRYRHETIDKEDSDVRNRHRIRARFGIEAEFEEGLSTMIEITSGSTDPVSNNQSLDDGFSTKDLGLNLAFVKWQPEQVKSISIVAGKMKNPFYLPQKAELIWDPDLNPEGIASQYKQNISGAEIFINGGLFWIEERSSDDESYLLGGQAGWKHHITDKKAHFLVGSGFYSYANIQGFKPFYDEDDSFGNSTNDDGNYREEFRELDFFGELGFKVNKLPIVFFGDFVTNTAADSNNTGWLAGISVGKAKEPMSWYFRYQYKRQEADAVVGLYTDSDFLGGGTDGKGHELNFSLQLTEHTQFGSTLFLNKLGLEEEKDYTRLQVDMKFKF